MINRFSILYIVYATSGGVDVLHHLSDYIGKAKFANERIMVTQRGKVVGAFVSMTDFEKIQAAEDPSDIAVYEEAKNGDFVDWDDVKAKLIKKHGFTKDEL